MNRKLKSTLGLVALLVFILTAGAIYIFVVQNGKIKSKTAKIKELSSHDLDQQMLLTQYQDAQNRVAKIDSALAARKYNIPQDIKELNFFDFLNKISGNFSELTKIDVEFVEHKKDKEFFIYQYKLTGSADYNDLYQLIYSIEQSKELKKIKSAQLSNMVFTDADGIPNFLVSYTLVVDVYYADNNRFSTASLVENNLGSRALYDAFYPLIRTAIAPNIDKLLDVQSAKLLAIVPEGAFLTDASGESFLLVEGDQVYLGYLTKIDYDHNKASFVLNKGGIIERVTLNLEKEVTNKIKK